MIRTLSTKDEKFLSPHGDVASSWLSYPVAAKDSDYVPTAGEVLRVYSKCSRLFDISRLMLIVW